MFVRQDLVNIRDRLGWVFHTGFAMGLTYECAGAAGSPRTGFRSPWCAGEPGPGGGGGTGAQARNTKGSRVLVRPEHVSEARGRQQPRMPRITRIVALMLRFLVCPGLGTGTWNSKNQNMCVQARTRGVEWRRERLWWLERAGEVSRVS